MHLAEERIVFQSRKSTHIYICTLQLQFVHFTQFIPQSGFLECIFPIRIHVVVLFIAFFKAEPHIFHGGNILQHFGNNLLPHFFVNLFRFLT